MHNSLRKEVDKSRLQHPDFITLETNGNAVGKGNSLLFGNHDTILDAENSFL